MADYRRYRVAGGTYFFTLVTHSRAPIFADEVARRILGDKLRACQVEWPFEITAIVLLPEHLHAIWTLPPGDDAYPMRWGWIKKEFTKAWLASDGTEQPVSETRRKRGDRGVWQPRYWEHTIQDEQDFDRHFDYVHYNPAKHGHVGCPKAWPHSSFHRWVEQGVYDRDWGGTGLRRLDFSDLDETAMELGIVQGGLCPALRGPLTGRRILETFGWWAEPTLRASKTLPQNCSARHVARWLGSWHNRSADRYA